MAWQAEIMGVEHSVASQELQVDVRYYDDVAPTMTLGRVSFSFETTLTIPQMRAVIVARGQMIRTTYQDRLTKAASFVGTIVAIT